MRNFYLRAASLATFILACLPAYAAETVEDEIVVSGERRDALADALAEKARRPGNVDVVPFEEYQDRYVATFRDALALTPGVIMQPVAGEDGRLSIRGSGLAQNVHLRGVELLLGGVPINAADGFGDFQEFDLLFASHINVLKGGNAFRVGAATLGGAIEVETLTAENAAYPIALRAEGGSFGTSRVNGHISHDFGRFDALFAATWQRQDGFRDHSRQNNQRVYLNLGYEWSDNVRTRVGVFYNNVDQELASSVSLDTALNDPSAANPGAIIQDWQRDIDSVRAFTNTTMEIGGGKITIGGTAAYRELYHPVPVFLIQAAQDYSGFLRYDGAGSIAGLAAEWSAGLRVRSTKNNADVFANNNGVQGFQFTDSVQRSDAFEVFGEGRLEVVPNLWAIAGISYVDTSRDFDNLTNDAADAETSFSHVSPKFGLLYIPSENLQFFANASASYEPPTFLDLTQGGIAGFQPIEAQDAMSYEIGARGTLGSLTFEAAFYRQEIDGEFVAFTTMPGIPAAVFNAGDTVHQGVEIFAALRLYENENGLAVTPRISWTYNDFAFDGDPIYVDNRLAGMPEHFGRVEILVANEKFRLAPYLTVQAGDNFVDYANTLKSPGYELFGVEASYNIAPNVSLFLEGRNLTDEGYVQNYSTMADASAPGANLSVFTPGEGRAIYGGVRIGFGDKQ
ncbi:MAG TPA: TonB-dependent receptor [Parvularculaceae bacterium]|nr:TonB-dependent receptor [Parvularculaceae bacterium]